MGHLIIKSATAGMATDGHPYLVLQPVEPVSRLARMILYEVAAKLEELSHEVGAGWVVGVHAGDLRVWIAADEDGLWGVRSSDERGGEGEPVEARDLLVEAANACGITVDFGDLP